MSSPARRLQERISNLVCSLAIAPRHSLDLSDLLPILINDGAGQWYDDVGQRDPLSQWNRYMLRGQSTR